MDTACPAALRLRGPTELSNCLITQVQQPSVCRIRRSRHPAQRRERRWIQPARRRGACAGLRS
ncbi:hypothetical protein DKC09_14665 [Klebsiella quasipneumoniae]|uniref:Uncharacterized protein n=1 Tax=Klebsiella quasipneumoniae TaxID=1463165 RepID=A0AAI8IYA6_9ENTR|nr:hypothetical protein DKC11_10990 [Klebsiella quasipneumoniae]AWL64270.1 hypothetical protein DKC00_22185 [Klebsiella quasipneumoniae]AWL74278.1 hypothetical protein DKC09_14665 [Klebsiella quasipneumoniae]